MFAFGLDLGFTILSKPAASIDRERTAQ
jgi:hypothetical protein